MVDVWLPYGKTEVCTRIPARNFLDRIEITEKSSVSDPRKEIERSLQNPINSEALRGIVKPGNTVVIVVDDATRSTPTNLIIPPILDELKTAGIEDRDITIIFGCGTHRPVTDQEEISLLGNEVVGRAKTVSHDCKAGGQVYVGKTKTHGTEVYLNRIFAEAEVKILTGDIGLHYYAGYGGGRKSVLPGVSSEETVNHNHSLLVNPKAEIGVLDGNPVHEDMMEAAKLAGVDFIVNVVVNGVGEIVKSFAGDFEEAFYAGTKLVDEMYRIPVDNRADIVVASSGGYPADLNLYQAYKAVHNALHAVKHGGVIILVAECPEGYGNQVFYEWSSRFKELKAVEKEIKRNFVLGGHKTYYLMKALQEAEIILVSSMPDYYSQNVFDLKTARAVNDAMSKAFNLVGKGSKVLAMPHGNLTLPETSRE